MGNFPVVFIQLFWENFYEEGILDLPFWMDFVFAFERSSERIVAKSDKLILPNWTTKFFLKDTQKNTQKSCYS